MSLFFRAVLLGLFGATAPGNPILPGGGLTVFGTDVTVRTQSMTIQGA